MCKPEHPPAHTHSLWRRRHLRPRGGEGRSVPVKGAIAASDTRKRLVFTWPAGHSLFQDKIIIIRQKNFRVNFTARWVPCMNYRNDRSGLAFYWFCGQFSVGRVRRQWTYPRQCASVCSSNEWSVTSWATNHVSFFPIWYFFNLVFSISSLCFLLDLLPLPSTLLLAVYFSFYFTFMSLFIRSDSCSSLSFMC